MSKPDSSTSKGDRFEKVVFTMIQELLNKDQLPINSKHSKVFQKKGYYSEKRKANIIIDISVECTLPGEDKPTMYLLIECKDYNHPIPVDDVEEFYSKTQQIVGLNAKAIMVTSNLLQSGALNFAISSGIRVLKLDIDGKAEILSYRKERSKVNNNSQQFMNAFFAFFE